MKKITVSSILTLSLFTSSIVSAAGFKDMSHHWASNTVEWAVQNGITKGYPDGTFKPNKAVTEAEFLTLLINAYQDTNKNFVVLKTPNHWADSYYNFAKMMNYPTSGFNDFKKRDWLITREKVAEIVVGTQGVNYSGKDAIHYLLKAGLAVGNDPNKVTINNFGGGNTLTRAEAVQFIKNIKSKGKSSLQVRPEQPSAPLPNIGVNEPIQGQLSNSEQQSSQTKPINQNENRQPASEDGKVVIVAPTYPDFLLPKDPVTEPAVQSFLDSLYFGNGKVTGKIPAVPSGHTMTLQYTDMSDGKNGVRKNDRDFSKLKAGDTFSIPVAGNGGKINFAIYKGNEGKNDATVYVPSMRAEWGSKR